ncbi:MAG: hypothetical protein HYV66_03170 [Candidatus Sungbacteria bacterium]|uniref:Uncharacterized protein n=1 Tax=Candidatus Sungiibacteriota bacterium TaxID=2750080 RepID=A0A931YE50_9BACT|nr:hypothetical protein [Candidatus Sungbacteria bacterium]
MAAKLKVALAAAATGVKAVGWVGVYFETLYLVKAWAAVLAEELTVWARPELVWVMIFPWVNPAVDRPGQKIGVVFEVA